MELKIEDVMKQLTDINGTVDAVNKLTVEIRAEVDKEGKANGERVQKLTEDLNTAMAVLDELKKNKPVIPGMSEKDAKYLEAQTVLAGYLREQKAGLTYVSDATGGFAVGSVISSQVIQNSKDAVPLLSLVDLQGTENPNNEFVVDTSTATIRNADGATTMPTVNTETLGKFLCRTHAFDGVALVNPDLLTDTDANIVETIMGKIQDAMDQKHCEMILDGNGGDEFAGLLTTKDIIDNRTVTSASTTFSVDEFKTFVYQLPTKYAINASLIMQRGLVGSLASYKATTGSGYLWTPPSAVNPGAFDGIPVFEVISGLNSSWATGKNVAIIGDFKKYIVRVKLDLAVQYLNELYMPMKAWYYKFRSGGGVALPEAFRVLKVK